MAARHDIIHIDFQANAGKANVALQSLQTEAKKSSDKVTELKKKLEEGLRANLPAGEIANIKTQIKDAERETKQWNAAYKDLFKGVRAVDEAIKQFNSGKGSVEGMSAALSKAARNAAQLQQSKMTAGSKEWLEMEALINALDQNILKANTDINGLVTTIKQGGAVSKATLTQAKSDLEQLLTLEVRGTKEWNNYDKQLKVVNGELNKMAEAERKAAQADQTTMMNKRMKELKTLSSSTLAETRRFWEQMVAGAEKGSAELAKYEAKLKQVTNEEKKRKTASAEQVLGNMNKFGVEQVRQAVQQMTQLRDSIQQGIPAWQHYNKLVKEGELYLKEAADAERIARGEAMSLADALKLSATAGGKGFQGTATQLKQAEAALMKASEAARKGSPEWNRYQEALAKVRAEMSNTGMTSERMRQILEKPANAKNLNELSAAVKRAKSELDLMSGTVGKNSAEYKKLAAQTKEAEFRLKELQGQAKGSATAFEKAWSRLKTYIGLYMGAAVAIQKLVATMGDLMVLSDKMGEVRKTTGFTADEVGRLSDNLAKLDTRTALTGLMELSAAAGQLGLKAEDDVRGFTEAANMLMVALPEMGKEGATAMLKVALATGEIDKIRQQMQEGLIEGSSATAVAMTKIGSTIDQLRANSAAAAPAITDFVKRVGAVGAQSGITIDQVAALGSTVDALGMRVEMSATALSRMIPAIKNNAFELAHAIGVAPNTIRDLFEAGRGMEAILMIFQHIKDAGMDEDSIEQMMNMGGMKDIMKDLNQQGARAGIVFAGLSQNVDELRRQLGVAKTAYEENIAIMNEYNKMNDTTAAKWERLKNQVEEMVVGDSAQKFLGGIIDGLKIILNLLNDEGWKGVAIKSLTAAFIALRLKIGDALVALIQWFRNLETSMKAASLAMKKMGMANWISALITLLTIAAWKIYEMVTAVDELDKELNRLDAEAADAERHVNNLVKAFNNYSKQAEETKKKQEELTNQTDTLRKEVDKLKKSENLSAEATKVLTDKENELSQKEAELKKATDESNKANDKRLQLIAEINSKYSTYLGYMLSEKTAAEQVASAHQLIVAALKEEMKQKSLNRRQEAVEKKYDEDLQEFIEDSRDELDALPHELQQRIMDRFREVLTSISYDTKGGLYSMAPIEGLSKGTGNQPLSEQQMLTYIKGRLTSIVFQETGGKGYLPGSGKGGDILTSFINGVWGGEGTADEGFGDWAKSYIQREKELEQVYHDVEVETTTAHRNTLAAAVSDMTSNEAAIAVAMDELGQTGKELSDERVRQLAQNANAILADYQRYGGEFGPEKGLHYFGEDKNGNQKEATLVNLVNSMFSNVDKKTRDRILRVAQQASGSTTTTTNPDINPNYTNPWGSTPSAESTDYALFDVNELVARRNQMDKFKNILKPDTDIKTVLAEDAALMKAINNGEIQANMEDVLNWYNRERLKIQQELKSERFSTNEGHWRDEATKKGRKRANPLMESDYALAELDRYYSRRKEMLEEARIKENMTEEMFNRQAELLEQEHLQKRSDLRNTFTNNDTAEEKERIKTFRAWWKKLEESGDLDEVPWATVESEWAKATAAQIGQNNLKAQKDLTQMQQITVKHLNEIAKIIAKERPYDGITENLQNNLTKMDILLKDMLDPSKYSPAEMVSENNKRLAFLLKESEHAYTLTAEQLMSDMGKEGFQAWADALVNDENSEELTQNLLAQLRTVYDSVQDAIKKEANQMKRQVEIMWNDTILPNGQSQKQFFESTLSALGLQEDQVKRANSMIGAGQASERVASKLAIQQMKVRLAMQTQYYNMLEKIGKERIAQLEAAGKLEDAEHVRKSLNLALSEEQKKKDEQRVGIQNQLEESQARLYQELKSWSELFASSLQSVFEASNTGLDDYYNSLAKMRLTGEGAGGGTYVIIENAGTSDAEAHYEYLDGEAALRRQLEIDQQNAVADAWKKVWDDINTKINDMITDQLNAMLQNASIDVNTTAVDANTEALLGLTEVMKGNAEKGNIPSAPSIVVPTTEVGGTVTNGEKKPPVIDVEYPSMEWEPEGGFVNPWEPMVEESNAATETILKNQQEIQKGQKDADRQMTKSSKASFAAMTAAANMYGVAYQAMSNDNLSTAQKVQMMIVQAAGQAAISMLTASMAASQGDTAANAPRWVSKTLGDLGPIAGPVAVGVFTALIGGLMGMAMSKISKSKSEIAQVTGASMGAGRLSTGMLTYAEGNINEFTDPSSLTPGRHYNVDGADGKTYRAKYMGKNAKTHITNGPEFHLVGEAGREAIIDAKTTRLMQMDDTGIWKAIQTLYNGGRVSSRRTSMRRGIPAFADGNLDEFEGMLDREAAESAGYSMEQMAAMQSSLDRQNDLLEQLLTKGVKGYFDVYGKNGLVDSYDRGKKTVMRHGEKY